VTPGRSSFVIAAMIAVSAACTQVGTDPAAVVALVFDALPFPAVVAGDTLRNEAGVVVPLVATPVNSDGNTVEGAAVDFLALDPGVSITDGGIIVSTNGSATTTTTARLVAQVGTLQSRPLTLVITQSPDSAEQTGTVDTLRYSAVPNSVNASSAITVHVLSTAGDEPANVRGWLVKYTVTYNGTERPANDSTLAWFIDPSNRRSAVDTTEADGRASRRLRMLPTGLADDADSLLVTATVTARGSAVPGSPITVVVHVRPQ
jgi:hypothetical protein